MMLIFSSPKWKKTGCWNFLLERNLYDKQIKHAISVHISSPSPNAETRQEGSGGHSGLRLWWIKPQTRSTQEAREWALPVSRDAPYIQGQDKLPVTHDAAATGPVSYFVTVTHNRSRMVWSYACSVATPSVSCTCSPESDIQTRLGSCLHACIHRGVLNQAKVNRL